MTLTIITLVFIAVFLIAKSASKQTKNTNERTLTDTDKPFCMKIDYKGEWHDATDEKGSMTLNADNSILIQTKKEFGATLVGATEGIAQNIMTICDGSDHFYDQVQSIGLILMENGIQVKEVEKFTYEVRPIVNDRVKKLIAMDNEWGNLGEKDKEDKREEYMSNAMVKFKEYVSPAMSNALTYLTFHSPLTPLLLREIITEYGLINLSTYCEYYRKKNSIISISNSKYRKPLEELVELGLAYTGKDMSVEELLSTLTLTQLNEIAVQDTKFKRKDKAIKFISEKDNISEIIEKNITLRALFILCPLPEKFKEFDIKQFKALQNYYNELACVLVTLYLGLSPIHYE